MPIITNENSLTYSLQVMQLNTTRHGTYTNVVSHVHWRLTAVDEEGNRVSSGGTMPIQIQEIKWKDALTGQDRVYASQFDPSNFIAYEDLKEDDVLEWVKTDPMIEQVKIALKKRLEVQVPTPIQAVPWDTSTQVVSPLNPY